MILDGHLDFNNVDALRQALFGNRRLAPELLQVLRDVEYLTALKAAR